MTSGSDSAAFPNTSYGEIKIVNRTSVIGLAVKIVAFDVPRLFSVYRPRPGREQRRPRQYRTVYDTVGQDTEDSRTVSLAAE